MRARDREKVAHNRDDSFYRGKIREDEQVEEQKMHCKSLYTWGKEMGNDEALIALNYASLEEKFEQPLKRH